MHVERGNIRMVVANVTALQRHWPILVKQMADLLALTEVRVRQREIPVMQTQLLSSDCDSEWGKPVEGANEYGGVSFCCKTLGLRPERPFRDIETTHDGQGAGLAV